MAKKQKSKDKIDSNEASTEIDDVLDEVKPVEDGPDLPDEEATVSDSLEAVSYTHLTLPTKA